MTLKWTCTPDGTPRLLQSSFFTSVVKLRRVDQNWSVIGEIDSKPLNLSTRECSRDATAADLGSTRANVISEALRYLHYDVGPNMVVSARMRSEFVNHGHAPEDMDRIADRLSLRIVDPEKQRKCGQFGNYYEGPERFVFFREPNIVGDTATIDMYYTYTPQATPPVFYSLFLKSRLRLQRDGGYWSVINAYHQSLDMASRDCPGGGARADTLAGVPADERPHHYAVPIALAMISAIRSDAGHGRSATHGPLADGPLLIDRGSVQNTFSVYFGKATVDSIQQTLTNQGYGSATLNDVLRSSSNTNGRKRYCFENDAMVVQFLALAVAGSQAKAVARYLWTYEESICQRTFEIGVSETGPTWAVSETKLMSQC